MAQSQSKSGETSQPHIQSSGRGWSPLLTSKNLSIIVTGITTSIALLRADPKDIPQIVKTVVDSNLWAMAGWVVGVVTLISAIVMINRQSKLYSDELNRLTKHRDDLQQILIGQSKK